MREASVQLVKEIMGRSPGKRDRSGDQVQGRRYTGGRRTEDQIHLGGHLWLTWNFDALSN